RRSDGGQRSFRECPCWRSLPVEAGKGGSMVGSGGISELAARSSWCMPIRIPLICQVNGGGSSTPEFAVADDVQSEARDGEGSQQPKGLHVPQDVDLAVHQHQYTHRNADGESNRPVWRPAEPIAP